MGETISLKKLDALKKQEFLEMYGAGGISTMDVCEDVSLSIDTVFRWRHTDVNFAEAYSLVDVYNRNNEDRDNERLKKIWLATFAKLLFSVTETCKACGIDRKIFNNWKLRDLEFKESYFETVEEKKDFIETQLMQNIAKGDTISTIFACKTQLKDRGYIEKQQVEHSGNFGVMLAPGKSEDAKEWEDSAKAQQVELVEKTNKPDERKTIGRTGLGKEDYMGAPGGKPVSVLKLSDIRSVVRRDKG